MNQIVNNALSCNAEESFEKFLDPDLDVDHFQNIIGTSSSKDTRF